MAYNLSGTFKDFLKVISLGVMASINGVSGDAFAMDDDWGDGQQPVLAPLSPATVRAFQGGLSAEKALEMAIKASMPKDIVGGSGAASADVKGGKPAPAPSLLTTVRAFQGELSAEDALEMAIKASMPKDIVSGSGAASADMKSGKPAPAPSLLETVRTFQGELSAEKALEMAIKASMPKDTVRGSGAASADTPAGGAAAAGVILNPEQDKFMRDLHNTVVSGMLRPFHDVVSNFNMNNMQPTEEYFLKTFTMCGRDMIQREVTNINQAFERDLPALKGYHTAHKAQINTPVDVEAYLNALSTGFKEILNGFMENVNDFLKAPTMAKSKTLELEGNKKKDLIRVLMEKFHISDQTKTLNAYFYGSIKLSEADMAAKRFSDLQIANQEEAAARLKVKQGELERLSLRLKPHTATVERLTAHIAGGRDADGYSTANEGIMRLGNNTGEGGYTLLGNIRVLLTPLLKLRDVAYIEPREGAALGFSEDDAIMFYRTLSSNKSIDVSGAIVDSFKDMMKSPSMIQQPF